MIEWIIVIVCFVGVAMARMFLFKKSYEKKLKYYTHPHTLASEVIAENRRQTTEMQFQNSVNIEKLSEQVGYNLGCAVRQIENQKPSLEEICERLRNISLYINILMIVHEKNKKNLTEQLKIIGSIIGPRQQYFTMIRDIIGKQTMSKRDQYLDKSVENYITHIQEDLKGYMS